LYLVLALVAGVRLAHYLHFPWLRTDFDLFYHAARHLLQGENPYPIATQWYPWPLYYPLPAVLLAIPFTPIPVEFARVLWDILIGWTFAYALWRHRGNYALVAVVSGAYAFAAYFSQTTPLLVAATLIPTLGFLLVVKPHTGLALWLAYPSRRALIGGALLLALSLVILPSWPRDWILALQDEHAHIRSPILRPFGFLLLLAALRWKTPEGRLLLIMGILPQNTQPHDLIPLALIPRNLTQMGIYFVGTWLAVMAVGQGWEDQGITIAMRNDAAWPMILGTVYLPMLYLVLRRTSRVPDETLP
jgi:hypothetical protein